MNDPQRKRLRLEAYDYSQPGYYFITICTQARQRLFDDFVGADLCVCPHPLAARQEIGDRSFGVRRSRTYSNRSACGGTPQLLIPNS